MNELQIFKNEQFGAIRTVTIDKEPWFVAVDVCRALELNPNATRRLEDDEKITLRLTQGESNRTSDTIAVNEPGLYSLVLGSRKPEAKAFKRWITHQVIPAIRHTGGYVAGQESMTDAEIMAKAILVAQRTISERNARISELETKIERDKPKVLFADAVSAAKTSILIGELAKLLKQNGVDIGQNRLFNWMRENGYLIRRKSADFNMPTQRSMELGLFEIKETVITHADGHVTTNKTPKVTGKGQQYFVTHFLSNQNSA